MILVGADVSRRFRHAYAALRAAEGRAYAPADLVALPYLRSGPLAAQWAVRARTFDVFMHRILRPMAAASRRPLCVLDLGAGNGWLAFRAASLGCRAIAVDVRDDDVDGLGAAAPYASAAGERMQRLVASFDALPLPAESADVAVFNAALHYAVDLAATIAESCRVVRRGGRIVILDSPFYRRAEHGEAMVAEKRSGAHARFGALADAALALPCIEYLTPERLACSTRPPLTWRRRRVRYPLWYESRPIVAHLRGRRPPSRFDLWEAVVP